MKFSPTTFLIFKGRQKSENLALKRSAFDTKQHIENLKHALEAEMIWYKGLL